MNHYLETLKLNKCIWLSEDASGILAKIEHDPGTNQMVGISLPINSKTGLPVPFSYLARSADEIKLNMNKEKSSYVYVMMAQPLKENVPPFVLQIFGTNNKFTAKDVLRRWKHTVNELQR